MVSTYSQLLRRKFGGQLSGNGDEYIGYLVEGSARMEQLLRDLRNYTRASTASQDPEADLDLNEALARSLATLRAAIDASHATVTHSPLPVVNMHEFQMDQLFQNLIGNAIRYRSEAAPVIHISAERTSIGQGANVGQGANFWTLSVRDNGIGIEPQYKEQIFGMFKRLHSSTEYPGTGMGLAICERIVQRGGGRIWVESEPGHGSTFFFTVPAAKYRD